MGVQKLSRSYTPPPGGHNIAGPCVPKASPRKFSGSHHLCLPRKKIIDHPLFCDSFREHKQPVDLLFRGPSSSCSAVTRPPCSGSRHERPHPVESHQVRPVRPPRVGGYRPRRPSSSCPGQVFGVFGEPSKLEALLVSLLWGVLENDKPREESPTPIYGNGPPLQVKWSCGFVGTQTLLWHL